MQRTEKIFFIEHTTTNIKLLIETLMKEKRPAVKLGLQLRKDKAVIRHQNFGNFRLSDLQKKSEYILFQSTPIPKV